MHTSTLKAYRIYIDNANALLITIHANNNFVHFIHSEIKCLPSILVAALTTLDFLRRLDS